MIFMDYKYNIGIDFLTFSVLIISELRFFLTLTYNK